MSGAFAVVLFLVSLSVFAGVAEGACAVHEWERFMDFADRYLLKL